MVTRAVVVGAVRDPFFAYNLKLSILQTVLLLTRTSGQKRHLPQLPAAKYWLAHPDHAVHLLVFRRRLQHLQPST